MKIDKKQQIKKIEIDLEHNTISIRRDEIIEEDNVEIARKSHRCAFCPGDIEEVKKYLGKKTGKEITFLKNMWTDDVIKAHKEKVDKDNNVAE